MAHGHSRNYTTLTDATHDGVMRLSASQASALFEGLQWSKMHTPRTQVPVTTR
jgi:hypothetical protein